MRMTLACFCLMLCAGIAAAADTTVAVSSGSGVAKEPAGPREGVWTSTGATGGSGAAAATTGGAWRSSHTWVNVSSGTIPVLTAGRNPEFMSGVTMKDGKMMLLMAGEEVIPLQERLTTTDGTRVQMTDR